VDLNRRTQQIWLWGGVFSIVAFTIGWVGLAQFLPPIAPSTPAADVAAEFGHRRNEIRLGALIMIVGTMAWIPFAAVVAAQTRKAKGSRPVDAWIQLGSAVVGTAVIIIAMMFWVLAAFRPERDPELTQTLVDAGFMFSIMPFAIFVLWNLGLTMAILNDTREEPAYPRWAAYFNVWCAVLYLPGGALAFFHNGVFAWNGLLAFYLPALAFFVWILVMSWLANAAIKRNARDEHAARELVTV
jgi:hypothetical protein